MFEDQSICVVVPCFNEEVLIGRVLDIRTSGRSAALAYWHGQYVAIDQDEDADKLAEASLPGVRAPREAR